MFSSRKFLHFSSLRSNSLHLTATVPAVKPKSWRWNVLRIQRLCLCGLRLEWTRDGSGGEVYWAPNQQSQLAWIACWWNRAYWVDWKGLSPKTHENDTKTMNPRRPQVQSKCSQESSTINPQAFLRFWRTSWIYPNKINRILHKNHS